VLNRQTCGEDPGPDPDPDPEPDPEPGERLNNPYAGAQVYVNPEWRAQAAANGGAAIANQPTAIWLDRIAAISSGSAGENTMGLADHLDEALDQGADLIQVVIYNLPGRDCAALASNGTDELDRYESEYIDVIAEIPGRPTPTCGS
jgi:cellulose 1,4-beta-cellobiosidase